MNSAMNQQIQIVAEQLVAAGSVACLTGAGISAESGVPTFRGTEGLWEGHPLEEVATPEGFARDPVLVWRFYTARRQNLLGVKPNPAHHALATLEQRLPSFTLVTQNVDGLHQQAGSRKLIALHGDIWVDRCSRCRWTGQGEAAYADLPRCPECGALRRPGVVWFGEMLPQGVMEAAAEAAAAADVMLVVGTSSVVYPAAGLAGLARQGGALVVEVNIARTEQSGQMDVTLDGPAGQVLPALVAALDAGGSGG